MGLFAARINQPDDAPPWSDYAATQGESSGSSDVFPIMVLHAEGSDAPHLFTHPQKL